MEIITLDLIKDSLKKTNRVACIGFFECIHKGHQQLLESCFAFEGKKTFITFVFEDGIMINKQLDELLMTRKQKIEIVESYGFDEYVEIIFNQDTQTITYDVFEKILSKWGIKTLICGYDFHYGQNRIGNTDTLQASGLFEVIVVEKLSDGTQKISSSYIKKLIKAGDIVKAAYLLGRNYTIRSHIIKGKQLGRKIGFPTANLKKKFNYVLPKVGVYAGYVYVDKIKYQAMINVGYNPTVEYLAEPVIEAHIFDFNVDIYGKEIDVEFETFIRDEKKFDSLDALVKQIKQDEIKVREYFNGTISL